MGSYFSQWVIIPSWHYLFWCSTRAGLAGRSASTHAPLYFVISLSLFGYLLHSGMARCWKSSCAFSVPIGNEPFLRSYILKHLRTNYLFITKGKFIPLHWRSLSDYALAKGSSFTSPLRAQIDITCLLMQHTESDIATIQSIKMSKA